MSGVWAVVRGRLGLPGAPEAQAMKWWILPLAIVATAWLWLFVADRTRGHLTDDEITCWLFVMALAIGMVIGRFL